MNIEHGDKDAIRRPRVRFAAGVLIAAVAVLLLLEHKAHLLGASPLLLLLLVCVGMHFLMHDGPGSHGDGDRPNERGSGGDGN